MGYATVRTDLGAQSNVTERQRPQDAGMEGKLTPEGQDFQKDREEREEQGTGSWQQPGLS